MNTRLSPPATLRRLARPFPPRPVRSSHGRLPLRDMAHAKPRPVGLPGGDCDGRELNGEYQGPSLRFARSFSRRGSLRRGSNTASCEMGGVPAASVHRLLQLGERRLDLAILGQRSSLPGHDRVGSRTEQYRATSASLGWPVPSRTSPRARSGNRRQPFHLLLRCSGLCVLALQDQGTEQVIGDSNVDRYSSRARRQAHWASARCPGRPTRVPSRACPSPPS